MLDTLRKHIHTATAGRLRPAVAGATRIVTVTLSEGLFSVKALRDELFPEVTPDLALIRPWVDATSKDFSERAQQAIGEGHSLDVASRLVREGISLNPSSLIVVIGDLRDSGAMKLLAEVTTSLQALALQSQAGHQYFWAGILLMSSENSTVAAEDLNVCGSVFQKLILLDRSNGSGLLSEEDRPFQVLHVWEYLRRMADSLAEGAIEGPNFVEWMQEAKPKEGLCSSFGGSTCYYPVNQVFETAAVQCGAQVLHDSLLATVQAPRHVFFVDRFRLDAGITSFTDLQASLVGGAPQPWNGAPGFSIPGFSFDTDQNEKSLVQLANIGGQLPALAGGFEASLAAVCQEKRENWKHLLDDYLDSIVTGENGGIHLAGLFLDGLVRSVRDAMAGSVTISAPASPDFEPARAALQKIPFLPGLALRAIVASALGGFLALSGPFFDTGNLAFAVIVVAAILIFSAVLFHASRVRAEREFAHLRGELAAQWQALRDGVTIRIASRMLQELCDTASSLKRDIDQAGKRTTEITEWFQEQYAPPVPRSSTLYWPLLSSSSEFRTAAGPLPKTVGMAPSAFRSRSRGPLLWRRMAAPGTPGPSSYECHLLEQAAIHMMPQAGRVLTTRILCRLRDDEKARTYVLKHNRLTAEPFICVRPGTDALEILAILEADGTDCETVFHELRESLSPYFKKVETIQQPSPYLVSVTSTATHIEMRHVLGLEGVAK